jgi:hypothetical protein
MKVPFCDTFVIIVPAYRTMRHPVDWDSRWKQTSNVVRGKDSEVIGGRAFALGSYQV